MLCEVLEEHRKDSASPTVGTDEDPKSIMNLCGGTVHKCGALLQD